MQPHKIGFEIIAAGGLYVALVASAAPAPKGFDAKIDRYAENMLAQGRKIFRGQLQLHKAIAHYDGDLKLNLTDANKKDLVEYLKGI